MAQFCPALLTSTSGSSTEPTRSLGLCFRQVGYYLRTSWSLGIETPHTFYTYCSTPGYPMPSLVPTATIHHVFSPAPFLAQTRFPMFPSVSALWSLFTEQFWKDQGSLPGQLCSWDHTELTSLPTSGPRHCVLSATYQLPTACSGDWVSQPY